MLKTKKIMTIALAALIGLSFASCKLEASISANDNNNRNTGTAENGIDYKDYKSPNSSVIVKNESDFNLVCFMGTPSADNLISGALGGGKTTGLRKPASLFNNKSFDFVLFVVKESDYLANKNNLKALENEAFCRLYAYYNANAANNANLIYTVSGKLGGENYFILNNTTKYNCEIRRDGLFGEPFMYAGAQTLSTKVYAANGDYALYPVFRKFDKEQGIIVTSFPKTAKGNPQRINIGLGGGKDAVQIDCSKYLGNGFKMTASAAYLTVNNQSGDGIKLYQGAQAVASVTDTGIETINSGEKAGFVIKMPLISDGEDGTAFEEVTTIASWKVGPDGYTIDVPSKQLQAGYRYILNVTGDSYDDIRCEFATYEENTKEHLAGDIVKYEVSLD